MVTHIGDGCRAAGFLPIAMPPSLRHSVDSDLSTFATGCYGVATPGSDWTRNRELSEWIKASQTHPRAWEGVTRLLQELRKRDQPLPGQLLIWAVDVATGTRRPPIRSRGRDGEALKFRNIMIVMAVEALRHGSLPATSATGESACNLVVCPQK